MMPHPKSARGSEPQEQRCGTAALSADRMRSAFPSTPPEPRGSREPDPPGSRGRPQPPSRPAPGWLPQGHARRCWLLPPPSQGTNLGTATLHGRPHRTAATSDLQCGPGAAFPGLHNSHPARARTRLSLLAVSSEQLSQHALEARAAGCRPRRCSAIESEPRQRQRAVSSSPSLLSSPLPPLERRLANQHLLLEITEN